MGSVVTNRVSVGTTEKAGGFIRILLSLTGESGEFYRDKTKILRLPRPQPLKTINSDRS